MTTAITDTLRRIAKALEALVPARGDPESLEGRAYHWDGNALAPSAFMPLALDILTGIDEQKQILVENTRRLADGFAAHDVLLWGARGAGKSALAKAVIGSVQADAPQLLLVDVAQGAMATLRYLLAALAQSYRPAVIFIDDLGFDDDISGARALRSLLDGGGTVRPEPVKFYVTSNRRHIVARDIAEQESAINARDVVDDRLALADRFGLSLGFHVADQDAYLDIVARYAQAYALAYEPAEAVAFATQRGSRSGRIAWHFIVELAGRAGRSLR